MNGHERNPSSSCTLQKQEVDIWRIFVRIRWRDMAAIDISPHLKVPLGDLVPESITWRQCWRRLQRRGLQRAHLINLRLFSRTVSPTCSLPSMRVRSFRRLISAELNSCIRVNSKLFSGVMVENLMEQDIHCYIGKDQATHLSPQMGGGPHFDGEEKWSQNPGLNEMDLPWVVLHQIRLAQTDDRSSAMYPSIDAGVEEREL